MAANVFPFSLFFFLLHFVFSLQVDPLFRPKWAVTMRMLIYLLIRQYLRESFPGGSVVKNVPANAGAARDWDLIPGLGRFPWGGNGNPFQYSCLRNPMDRGAWKAVVHRVTESQTRLKRLGAYTILFHWYICFLFLFSSTTMFWIVCFAIYFEVSKCDASSSVLAQKCVTCLWSSVVPNKF